jgi:hypothetical protein
MRLVHLVHFPSAVAISVVESEFSTTTQCKMLALTTVALSLSLLGIVLAQIDDVGINLADEVGKYHQPKRSTPTATCLVADALQTASFRTGLENGTAGIRPGLTESPTRVKSPIPSPTST